MAFGEFHLFSPALGKQTALSVVLPEVENQTGPFPVYYLLHGLSDDNSAWSRRTSIERYVQMLPLIVVMPDGGRGWYCDAPGGSANGYAYERAIIEDVVGFVDRSFNTRAERGGRAIGGLSMGGYGAIKLALKYPELFGSANGHSSALGFAHAESFMDNPEFARIIGPQAGGSGNDLWTLAQRFQDNAAAMPALRIDCGTGDFTLEQNREFHAYLDELKLPHQYEEFAGAHDWAYWDKHVQGAIRFHAAHLGISKPVVRG